MAWFSEVSPRPGHQRLLRWLYLPASSRPHVHFVHLWLLCVWMVGVTHLNGDGEADARSFSVSHCQLGWSRTQISRYRNEHPTMMPLFAPSPSKPFFPPSSRKPSGFVSRLFEAKIVAKVFFFPPLHYYLLDRPTVLTWLSAGNFLQASLMSLKQTWLQFFPTDDCCNWFDPCF